MMNKKLKQLSLCVAISIIINSCSLQLEHKEAASVPIKDILIKRIADGTYNGSYSGGMKGWRENKVSVTVNTGKITDVKLLFSKEVKDQDRVYTHLVDQIISKQSLQIDALAGATLTTRAHLKAIENALLCAPELPSESK